MAFGELSPDERMHGGDEPPMSIHNPELPLLISGAYSETNANAGLTTGDQQDQTNDETADQQLHSKPLLLS